MKMNRRADGYQKANCLQHSFLLFSNRERVVDSDTGEYTSAIIHLSETENDVSYQNIYRLFHSNDYYEIVPAVSSMGVNLFSVPAERVVSSELFDSKE